MLRTTPWPIPAAAEEAARFVIFVPNRPECRSPGALAAVQGGALSAVKGWAAAESSPDRQLSSVIGANERSCAASMGSPNSVFAPIPTISPNDPVEDRAC
jgi:hypothetical protein